MHDILNRLIELLNGSEALFSIGNQSVCLLELICVILGLTSVFFASRAKIATFKIGYFYMLFLFFLFYQKQLYSSMILQPISLFLNILGHYRWSHPKETEKGKSNSLKVTVLSTRMRLIIVFSIIIITLLWGTALGYLPKIWTTLFSEPRKPYLDAFITASIITAQYLSAQKKLECWCVWLTVNSLNITLYLFAGMIFMPIVSASYLVLAIFGFAKWKKLWILDKDKQ